MYPKLRGEIESLLPTKLSHTLTTEGLTTHHRMDCRRYHIVSMQEGSGSLWLQMITTLRMQGRAKSTHNNWPVRQYFSLKSKGIPTAILPHHDKFCRIICTGYAYTDVQSKCPHQTGDTWSYVADGFWTDAGKGLQVKCANGTGM